MELIRLFSILSIIILFSVYCFCQTDYIADTYKKREITLDECIATAFKESQILQIKLYAVSQSRLALGRENSFFDTVLWSNLNSSNLNMLADSTLDGVDILKINSLSMNVGLSKQLAIGSKIELFLNNYYENTNIVSQVINPLFKTVLGINIRQPILSGRNKISTTYKIDMAEENMKIVKNEYSNTRREIERDVKGAFAELCYYYNCLIIAKEILDIVNELQISADKKFKLGEISKIDLMKFKERVWLEQVAYMDIYKMLKESEILLKKRMNLQYTDSDWRVSFIPLERFEPHSIDYTLEHVYQAAINNSHQYYKQKKEIKKKEIILRVSELNKKPVLNAVIGAGLNGMKGNLEDTYAQMFESGYYNWQVGLEFAMPIGNTEKSNTYKEAELELSKAKLELQNMEIEYFADISIKINQLMLFKDKIGKLQKLSESANERVKAMGIKFSKRMAANNDVLNAIYEMKDVRAELNRAIFENNIAVIEINSLIGE